jgi:ribosomal protein S20
MNFSTENERFSAMQGGRGKIAAGIAKCYFEDNFVPDNEAERKKSRLNAKAFC